MLGKCPAPGCHHTPFGSVRALAGHLLELHHYSEADAQAAAQAAFAKP